MSESTSPQEADPREELQAMIERGAGNSPDAIMLRLLWLRREHPQAAVATDVLHIEHDRVVIRAAISLHDGAAGSGIAAAHIDDDGEWADVVERTETIAISRALDTLGYVLRAATTSRLAAPSPASESQAARPEPVSPPVPDTQTVPQGVPAEAPSRPRPTPPRMDESAPSVVSALRRANRPAEPRPATDAQSSPASEDDAHLEEYSWNSFWSRARELGLTPEKVTEALGRPAAQMTPKEAVTGLVAAGAWPSPEEA